MLGQAVNGYETTRMSVLAPRILNHTESITSPSPEVEISHKRAPKVILPANAFILYRKHHHLTMVEQNSGLHNSVIPWIILLLLQAKLLPE